MPNTVFEQLKEAAGEQPNRPFLCYPKSAVRGYLVDGAEITYGSALKIVEDIAQRYQKAGYQAGHRAALVVGNRPDHFWHYLALNSFGASAVPLNPEYLKHEFAYGIDFAECAIVIVARSRLEDVSVVVDGLTTSPPVIDAENLPEVFPPPARPPAVVTSNPSKREALILYTSGTTGVPKGCIISNRASLAAGECYTSAGGLVDFDYGRERLFAPFPSFHTNLSVYALNAMMRIRGCIILDDRFHASTWWTDIISTKATSLHYLGIIPPLLVKAPHSPLDHAHRIKFGLGAGCDPSVRDAFEARFGFPLIEVWGSTETSRCIKNCRVPRDTAPRAFGRPQPPWEVMVADENDRPLPFGAAGELLVRSAGPDPRDGFFSGYLKQPEETESAWRNGWFHTGDVGTQREDGMLSFVERRKNIIRRSGENISAAEIENALVSSPDVESVVVLSVPDELHDEEIMACIVLMSGVQKSAATAFNILDNVRSRLAHYKLPGWMAFIDTIPVTSTQKIRKWSIFQQGTDPRADSRSIDLRHFKRRQTSSETRQSPSGDAA
jgi:acyl-CoA synthetase (AMP-forming)/AMP-acid ligase II